MKLYILVKDSVNIGHAINGVAHSTLILDDKYKNDDVYNEWKETSFKKVTCKVKENEFNEAKKFGDYIIVKESNLDNNEIVLAFKPRKEWPLEFKDFKLYS